MKLDDVIALARAGFDAKQIGALYNLEQAASAPTPTPTPAPAPTPEPTPTPPPTPAPTPAPAPAPAPATYEDLMRQIMGLKDDLHNAAIITAGQPAPLTTEQAAEQALASIIAPAGNGSNKKEE